MLLGSLYIYVNNKHGNQWEIYKLPLLLCVFFFSLGGCWCLDASSLGTANIFIDQHSFFSFNAETYKLDKITVLKFGNENNFIFELLQSLNWLLGKTFHSKLLAIIQSSLPCKPTTTFVRNILSVENKDHIENTTTNNNITGQVNKTIFSTLVEKEIKFIVVK